MPLPDRVLEALDQIEVLIDEIRQEMQDAVTDSVDTDEAVDETTLRRARFVKAFIDAGGELTREQTHSAAQAAGYDDLRGIAGWYNGTNATLRQTASGKTELTGAGYEYWRSVRQYVE